MGPPTPPGTRGLAAQRDKPPAGSEALRTARLPTRAALQGGGVLSHRNPEPVPAACPAGEAPPWAFRPRAAQGGPGGGPQPENLTAWTRPEEQALLSFHVD